MPESIEPGRVVVSTAGRDRGKFYLVLMKGADNRVYVVNGETRKLSNPKRKNKKHLRPCPEISMVINEKIKTGLKVMDIEIRKALREATANYS